MVRTALLFLAILYSFETLVSRIDCSSESRFIEDTRECDLEPWNPGYDPIFEQIESMMARSGVHIAYVGELYRRINQLAESWMNVSDQVPQSRSWKSALKLLNDSNGLQTRDCLDICTYVLTKNNCKFAHNQDACYPRSRKQSFIKSMLDARVFPVIDRCQSSLMYNAIVLNTTSIEPDMYGQVYIITEFMSLYKSSSIEQIALTNARPHTAIRALIKPQSTGFFENLFQVMIQLEKYNNASELQRALQDPYFNPSIGFIHFDRLVLTPCNRFIQVLREALDPTIYYGGIMDLDQSKFQLEYHLSDADLIKYFKLVHMFQACVWLNNRESFDLSWEKLARNYASRRRS